MVSTDSPDWLPRVDTSQTPKARDVLYVNNALAVSVGQNVLGGANNWFDLSTYTSVLVELLPYTYSLAYQMSFVDDPLTGQAYGFTYDVYHGAALWVTQAVMGRYGKFSVWTATADTNVKTCLYGLQTAGVSTALDFPWILVEKFNVTITAGSTVSYIPDATWAGNTWLCVFGNVSTGMVVEIRERDYNGNATGTLYRHDTTGLTGGALKEVNTYVACGPRYSELRITNTDASDRAFNIAWVTAP